MTEQQQGRFIVVEGLEGAGKSTAMATITDWLAARGIGPVVTTREPGGTPMAEAIRELFKRPPGGEPVSPATELMLMYAARRQLLEQVIWPAMARGQWVVADRHDWSTLAYQGGGRQIPFAQIAPVRQVALEGRQADLTLLMDLPAAVGLERARGRGALDRIEQESAAFFERTRQRYLELAATEPNAVIIDAAQPLAHVAQQIEQALTAHWSRLHGGNGDHSDA